MSDALNIISQEHRGLWRLTIALDVLRQQLDEQAARPDRELFNLIFDYIDSYVARVHEPKEEQYLFKWLRQRSPASSKIIDELEREHREGPQQIAVLRDALVTFARDYPEGRKHFQILLEAYIKMARDHIMREEGKVFPLARSTLHESDWQEIDAAFANNDDPMFGENAKAEFRMLLTRIVNLAPEPIGLGMEHSAGMFKPEPGETVLEIEGLTSHYGRIQALKGVTLKIGQGQLVALVGANGAGKTTLLRTISGVQKASGGYIRFMDQDITHMRPDKRVKLGICQVPEGRQVFGPMSVEDNLRLGAYTRSRNDVADDMDRMYQMFPILRQKHKQPAGTLSGGQQQMLAIARALMGRPKLLLLDEPSMGLAPLLVEEIFNAIIELRRHGITIFLVEQNAHAALSVADVGYVIETGQTVLSGPGPELLENEQVKQAYLGM